jgi:hypothetical protein
VAIKDSSSSLLLDLPGVTVEKKAESAPLANGEPKPSDDPEALLKRIRGHATASPGDLAELVSEIFALNESQCADVENDIIARGPGIAIQAAEWTLQEYRENAGKSYMAAFYGKFMPRKSIGQKKTELKTKKEPQRQAERDPRAGMTDAELHARTAPLRTLLESSGK